MAKSGVNFLPRWFSRGVELPCHTEVEQDSRNFQGPAFPCPCNKLSMAKQLSIFSYFGARRSITTSSLGNGDNTSTVKSRSLPPAKRPKLEEKKSPIVSDIIDDEEPIITQY